MQQAHTATLPCNRFQTEQHQNIGAAWLATSQGNWRFIMAWETGLEFMFLGYICATVTSLNGKLDNLNRKDN